MCLLKPSFHNSECSLKLLKIHCFHLQFADIEAYIITILNGQLCLTLWDSMDWACQGPLSKKFSRQKILEWVAIHFSRGSSLPKDHTQASSIPGRFFTVWTTREAQIHLHHTISDITEAEDIKKRWQEYTEEQYKQGLHAPDNHNGVITHLEPDILECEVKWALESIAMNKASGGDGIPVELFQILKDDAMKGLHSICQQIWKAQQWP